MKKVILTANAPKPIGPYSQAIQAGQTLYCSGQIPLDPKTGEILKGSVKEEAQLVMKNIEAVLKEAGYGFEHIVKTNIFLISMSDFAAVNEIYGQYFKSDPPARSTIAVKELPKGAQVEIEVVAYR